MPTEKEPPDIGLGEERVADDEPAAIAEIERLIRAQVTLHHPPGVRPARRGQHPKSHGCADGGHDLVKSVGLGGPDLGGEGRSP